MINKYIQTINSPDTTDPLHFPIYNKPSSVFKHEQYFKIPNDVIDLTILPCHIYNDVIFSNNTTLSSYEQFFIDSFHVNCFSFVIRAEKIVFKNKIYHNILKLFIKLSPILDDFCDQLNIRLTNPNSLNLCRHIQFIPLDNASELFNLKPFHDPDLLSSLISYYESNI
jgi:hypothetical protein